MTLRHNEKREDRQVQILFDLATNGNQSVSSLAKLQETNRTNVDSSLKILLKLGYLKQAEKKFGRGTPEKLYKITKSGLELLSKDKRITLKKFWKIVFLVYDKKVIKTQFPIDMFFSNYENHVLGYDMNFLPISLNITLENISYLYPVTKTPTMGISMLVILGINKPISKNNIILILKNKNPLKIKTNENIIDSSFQRLIQDNLIVELTDEDVKKYRITILGFLVLMKFLDKSQNELYNDKRINTDLIIKKVIKNNQMNFSLISKNWNILRTIVDESNAVILFGNILDKKETISGSIHAHGIRELLIIERIMTEYFKDMIREEAKIGREVLSELVKRDKIDDGLSSYSQKRLLFLHMISNILPQDQRKVIDSIKGKEFSFLEQFEKTVSNTIAFEFFIFFIDRVIDEKQKAGNITQLDRVGKWHFSKVKKWNEFQKNNQEFRDWFNEWIRNIRKFEEKNIEILSKWNIEV